MSPSPVTEPSAAPRVTWDEDAYASVVRRAAGLGVDVLVLSVLLTLVAPLVGAGDAAALDPTVASGPLQALALVVIVYDVVMTSRFGWTIGKRAVGIEVRTADGRLPWVGLAVGRFFLRYLSGAPLLLGFVWAAFDGRNQTWHDKLCQTYVLNRSQLRPRDDGLRSDPWPGPDPAGTDRSSGEDADPNGAAVAAAALSPGDRAWLDEVAAQVDARLDRVARGWRYRPTAGAARATAFGLLLGHLAQRHPGSRPQLSRVAEAHPSFHALLAGSRLSTLEQIAGDPQRVASWLGPLVEERDVEQLARLFD